MNLRSYLTIGVSISTMKRLIKSMKSLTGTKMAGLVMLIFRKLWEGRFIQVNLYTLGRINQASFRYLFVTILNAGSPQFKDKTIALYI
jgi:hypothetical protein